MAPGRARRTGAGISADRDRSCSSRGAVLQAAHPATCLARTGRRSPLSAAAAISVVVLVATKREAGASGRETRNAVSAVGQRTGRLNGDRELIRGDGGHVRVQFAAHRELVTGRDLILGVVLELDGRPMRCGHAPIDASPAGLTGREREVVALVALGRRRREVAEELFLSEATVRTHLRNAMHKLDVHSQA